MTPVYAGPESEVIQYFEVEPSPFLSNPADTWNDYDLHTHKGVPKGAVAEIVIYNVEDEYDIKGGVRTDGSTIDRAITLHEAEGGGFTTATMLVKVDEDTGLIETFVHFNIGSLFFFLVGYFVGVDFTEMFTALGWPSWVGSAWEVKDLSPYGVPGDRVVQIMMTSSGAQGDRFTGVREVGSTLERIVILDEAEGDSWGPSGVSHSVVSMMVKTNEAGEIEWVGENDYYPNVVHYALGYFSSNVDFEEGYTSYNPVVDDVWESIEIIESPEETYNVVSFALTHQDAGKETYVGLRSLGSSQARIIWEHEAEGGAWTGFMIHSSPVDRWAQIFCEDASEAHFYYTGYYIIGPLPPPPGGLTPFLPVFAIIAGILILLLVHDEKRRRR